MPEIWLNYGSTDVVLDIKAENLEEKIDIDEKIITDSEIELQDTIADERLTQDILIENKNLLESRRKVLNSAMKKLNEREKDIIIRRRLNEKPMKLEELSKKYNISRERVRQIEERAFEKLKKTISN